MFSLFLFCCILAGKVLYCKTLGETGETPVRARRREAHIFGVCLPNGRTFGTSHWNSISEKAAVLRTVEISQQQRER